MGFEVTKRQFELLAVEKLTDAELLLENRRWSNAYYLVGYAVELACASQKALRQRRFRTRRS